MLTTMCCNRGFTAQQNLAPHNFFCYLITLKGYQNITLKLIELIDSYPKVKCQLTYDFELFNLPLDLIYLLTDRIDRLIDQRLDQLNSFSVN